jgi:hypothetical protein
MWHVGVCQSHGQTATGCRQLQASLSPPHSSSLWLSASQNCLGTLCPPHSHLCASQHSRPTPTPHLVRQLEAGIKLLLCCLPSCPSGLGAP